MELVSKTQSLLTSLDDCITIDDVISGGEALISVLLTDCHVDHDLFMLINLDHSITVYCHAITVDVYLDV